MKLHTPLIASLLLGASLSGRAEVITTTIDFTLPSFDVELAAMNLQGRGLMPLGRGPLAINDGYRNVYSELLLTESPTATSTLTGSLGVNGSIEWDGSALTLLGGMLSFTLDIDYQIYTVLTVTDIDPVNDYAAGLASPITMDPSIGSMSGSVDVDVTLLGSGGAIPGGSIGVDEFLSAKIADLGVDVNGNGPNDYLQIALDHLEADFEMNLDDVSILLGSGTPRVSLNVDQLVFSGAVGDVTTDPPFGPITLSSAPLSQVPAPPGLALLGIGLVALWPRLRQRQAARGRC
jgi:hypothetical protein